MTKFNEKLLEVNPYVTNNNENHITDVPNNTWSKIINSCRKWIKQNNRSEVLTPFDYLQTKTSKFKRMKIHNDKNVVTSY